MIGLFIIALALASYFQAPWILTVYAALFIAYILISLALVRKGR